MCARTDPRRRAAVLVTIGVQQERAEWGGAEQASGGKKKEWRSQDKDRMVPVVAAVLPAVLFSPLSPNDWGVSPCHTPRDSFSEDSGNLLAAS